MAYRRKGGVTRSATFNVNDEIYSPSSPFEEQGEEEDVDKKMNPNPKFGAALGNENGSFSLGARATRASAAHRHSSAYAYAYTSPTTAPHPSSPPPPPLSHRHAQHLSSPSFSKESNLSENDSKYGFWGILARKAKSILEEDNPIDSSPQMKSQMNDSTSAADQLYTSRQSSETGGRIDNARLKKRLDAITSSLNHLGDTLGNAFEEGRTIMEHKTADIIQETRSRTADFIQETRKLQLRRRGGTSDSPDQATVVQNTSWQRPVVQPVQTTNQETQLKASRDVAMATAAKAKVLLRELKTVKADLAFAKERCSQLEEENKRLRESREKGDNPADDDLIRLQLETLLAEKARLAHENSIYARENRFLREIVEYHQLTMQDVVYLDEGNEEVTEVYPFSIDDAKMISTTPISPISPSFLPEVSTLSLPPEMEHTTETLKEGFNNTS